MSANLSSLGIEKLDYEETRNIARIYRTCGKVKESIEKFKEAAVMEEDNWLCLWGLTIAYEAHSDWTLAIETLEGVINSIKSKSTRILQ